MDIIEYYLDSNKEYWLEQIKKSDWGAGKYLYDLLVQNKVKKLFGDTTKVLLLVDGKNLVSFCTLAEQDEIKDVTMTPWIGFVYTFPEYRGKRAAGEVLEYAYNVAKKNGSKQIYISTDKIGVYENYGYEFNKMMKEDNGEEARIYKRLIL